MTRSVTSYREFAVDLMADGTPNWPWEHHQPLIGTRAAVGFDAHAFRTRQPTDRFRVPVGWHLTCQGSVEDVTTKLRSYAHTELRNITDWEVAERVVNRRDVVDRCALLQVGSCPPSAARYPHLYAGWVIPQATAYLQGRGTGHSPVWAGIGGVS